MDHDRTALKREVSVALSEDLIREARMYTRNLGATLESLLEGFVASERARRRAEDAVLDQVVNALGALHTEHGLLSNTFSAL